MASGDGNEASRREPVGRKQWEHELATTRIIRRKVDSMAAEDRARNLLDRQVDEIVADLQPGANTLERVTFSRVVKWLLLDRDTEADKALAAGYLVMGPILIKRARP
jgi:hypothetical protein